MSDMPPQPSAKTIGAGAFWSTINQGAHQLLVLAVFLVTARFVSVEAFGVMAVCLLIIESFRQIFAESIATYIYARNNVTPADYNAAFFIVLAGSIAAAIVVAALSTPVAMLMEQENISTALLWMSILLLTTGLSKIHEAWLVKNYHFKTLAMRSLASITLGGTVGIYMAMHDYGLYSLIAQQLITAISALAFLWISCKWRPALAFTKGDIVSTLQYSRHISAFSFINFINGQSDTFFASYFLGPAATGFYNAAKRIIAALNTVLQNGVNQVVLPLFAEVRNTDDLSHSSRAFLKCVIYTGIVSAPIFFGLAALSADAVFVLLGDGWMDVAPVLAILSIATYIGLFSRYNMNIFLTHDKPSWQTNITLAGAIANILLLLFVARYGLMALTIAYFIKSVILFPIHLHLALKLIDCRLKTYIAAIWPPVIAAAIMSAAIYWLAHNPLGDLEPWARTAMLVPAGALVYAGALLLFDRKNSFELVKTALHVFRK